MPSDTGYQEAVALGERHKKFIRLCRITPLILEVEGVLAMAQNDNLTPQVQQAINENETAFKLALEENRAWWLEKLRKHYHPNIQGLPDYGLASLKPETESYCRALCEKHGFCYEHFKEQYATRTQVIQPRERNPISSKLREKGVCPINRLDESFTAYIQGGVSIKLQLRNERADQIKQAFGGVK